MLDPPHQIGESARVREHDGRPLRCAVVDHHVHPVAPQRGARVGSQAGQRPGRPGLEEEICVLDHVRAYLVEVRDHLREIPESRLHLFDERARRVPGELLIQRAQGRLLALGMGSADLRAPCAIFVAFEDGRDRGPELVHERRHCALEPHRAACRQGERAWLASIGEIHDVAPVRGGGTGGDLGCEAVPYQALLADPRWAHDVEIEALPVHAEAEAHGLDGAGLTEVLGCVRQLGRRFEGEGGRVPVPNQLIGRKRLQDLFSCFRDAARRGVGDTHDNPAEHSVGPTRAPPQRAGHIRQPVACAATDRA